MGKNGVIITHSLHTIGSGAGGPTRGTLSPALALGPDCWTRWNAEIVKLLSVVPLSPILAATFMPPRGRPTLVVLSPVASSSVASLSSASFCDAAAASLPIPCSRYFSRISA